VPSHAAISAVFPAYERTEDTLQTLARIKTCDPMPMEIIVHVDGGRKSLVETLAREHPDVKVLMSASHVGPGGARNFLIREASQEWVANFDDDSEPETADFFARALHTARLFPEAAVISAANLEWEKNTPGHMRFGIFSGCGCVYRRASFLKTTGYVPMRIAYCMEEVDLSLRLFDANEMIVHDPLLRVNHRKVPPLAASNEINAHVLANIALMPLLRYPLLLTPLFLFHLAIRAGQMARRGLWRALMEGVRMIPDYAVRHWKYRAPVSTGSLLRWLLLRRNPVKLPPRTDE
jgi:GT2 family glycosyltransferase